MKTQAFAVRTLKEILRDPLNLAFGLGFPVVVMLLLSAIQANIPVPLFEIERLAPGITVFGLSFMTLFSATLVAKDRESAFLQRLYTTPLTAADYILGYALPLLPMALGQTAVCYGIAAVLGLKLNGWVLLAVMMNIPAAMLFIALGLLCGSVFNSKQVGGICGALLTNLCAWLSGIWFDIGLVGGFFEKLANLLPFSHGVKLVQLACIGDCGQLWVHFCYVVGYAIVIGIAAVLLFLRQMKRQ